MSAPEFMFLRNPSETLPYKSFTFPRFQPKLEQLAANTIALGVSKGNQPVGLILGETYSKNDSTEPPIGCIHSIFVQPLHRRQGLGSALLQRMESELKERGCHKIHLKYLSSFKSLLLQQLLSQAGWRSENTGTICYASKAKVLETPSPHLIDYIDRLARKLPPDYEVFPWVNLTPKERETLKTRIKENPLYKKFNPFLEENIIEPINSLGLRQNGEIVGWMVNHRIASDTIRYTQLFVDPETQPLSRGLLILAEAIRLHPDNQYGTFNFEPTNTNMVNLVQRRLKPYLTEIRKVYSATKQIVTRPSFYELKDFPKLKHLAENWKIIYSEFKKLNAPLLNINRIGKNHQEIYVEVFEHIERGGEYGWVKGWGENEENSDWIQYGLVAFDEAIPYAREKMPKTLELLDRIEGIKICALVTLKANSLLSTHKHPELYQEGLLQLHITLDAPKERNFAYLNVNGEFKQHLNGSAFIFDGSLDHFAVNASNKDRTILYMEFDRSKLKQS